MGQKRDVTRRTVRPFVMPCLEYRRTDGGKRFHSREAFLSRKE